VKNRSYNAIIILIVTMMLSGCSDVWLDEKPPHLISSETLYTNLAGFESGLNAIYAMVRQEKEPGVHNHAIRGCLTMNGTDNMVTNYWTYGFTHIAQNWGDNNSPSDNDYKLIFEWLYEIINSANTIVNQAEKEDLDWAGSSFNPAENKYRVIAEARAIRAWAYRHLTYCWGDVPLSLEESLGSTIRTDWIRHPVHDVRRQIVFDLLFSEKHIPNEPHIPGRITKGAVQHYLAEMYLVLNKPDSTLFWANQAINTPEYRLITERYGVKSSDPGVPFMDMFLEGNSNREEGNTEALWVFQFEHEVNGGGGSDLLKAHGCRYWNIRVGTVSPFQVTPDRGGRGYSRLAFTNWSLGIYESFDDRFSDFAIRKYLILKDEVGNAPFAADRLPEGYQYGDTIWLDWSEDISPENRSQPDRPYSKKADGTDPNYPLAAFQWNDQVYLRLAETYLLKAEAQLLLGSLGESAETINIIRRRSNASEITSSEVDIDFILDERSRELFLEEHRRYTLLRTNKWLERTRTYNHNGGQLITERDMIFPIPQSVIDANLSQKMNQNPGYE
jgi:hypothetical protein